MGWGEIENYVLMVSMGKIFHVVTHTTSTTKKPKTSKGNIYSKSKDKQG